MVIFRYIFSVLLICAGGVLFAQTAGDSVSRPTKPPIDWKPSLVRVGYDVAGLGLTLTTPDQIRMEGMAEVDFGNWFLVGEYGYQSTSRGENYDYQSSGRFWRIGLDKNLTPKLPGGHVVSFGMRYARSRFDELFEYGSYQAQNIDLSAGWVELTTGIRMRIWEQLYMGYQLRLRGFKRLSDELGDIQTFDIPGFGRNKKSGQSVRNGGVGFTYYVYWTIPFREKMQSVPQN